MSKILHEEYRWLIRNIEPKLLDVDQPLIEAIIIAESGVEADVFHNEPKIYLCYLIWEQSLKNRLFTEKPRCSQNVSANLSGVSQSRFSLIENELVVPSEAEKKKLAKALGKRVDKLFDSQK